MSTDVSRPRRVAVYVGEGTSDDAFDRFSTALADSPFAEPIPIDVETVTGERLDRYSAVILPGGRGSWICRGLGDGGKASLRGWVHDGGRILGVCAGAYALNARSSWALGLLGVRMVSKYWRRGTDHVRVRWTPAGRQRFGVEDETRVVWYHNGPVFEPFSTDETSALEILATFDEDLVDPRDVPGRMLGAPAVAWAPFGRGRAMAISPHFEKTDGCESVVRDALSLLVS